MVIRSRVFTAYVSVALYLHVYECNTYVYAFFKIRKIDRKKKEIERVSEWVREEEGKKEITSVLKLRNLPSIWIWCVVLILYVVLVFITTSLIYLILVDFLCYDRAIECLRFCVCVFFSFYFQYKSTHTLRSWFSWYICDT